MNAIHRRFFASACFALVLFVANTLHGQIDRGAISGTVTDPAGAVVTNATVVVTNTGTGQALTLTTDSAGNYIARSLHFGTYSVEAKAPGFKNTLQTGIELTVDQVAEIDLKLAVGAASEVTQVTGSAPLIATETSSLGTIETEKRIEDLPLNGRLFTQLAWLGPGTSQGSSSGIGLSGSTDDNRPGIQLAVNGLWAFDNNFLLDGVDNNGIGDGTIAVNPSPDAIGEFRVEENSMKAEFGRGGAAVNAALKSGTNQIHGGMFEYMRNDVLDARNYFNTGDKAGLHRNQFGAYIGGPIIKNRTFFFGDYQGSRLHEAISDISTVPTLPERSGDFSDRGLDLYNPYSTTTETVGGQTEYVRTLLNPSNPSVIPTGMTDQIGQNLVNLFPLPNRDANGPLNSNFQYFPVATWTGDQFDIRIDHKLTDHDQLFGHAAFENRPQFAPVPFPGEAEGCCGGNQDTREQNYAIGYTHTFGSNVLNDLRFAFIRYGVHSTPVDFGQNISDQVGIPNANRGNEETSGLATININNYSNLGNSGWIPELSADNTYQIADSLGWVRGKHTIKVGVDYRKYQRNFYQSQAAFGQFSFSGQLTQDLTGVDPNGGGSGLADLLLGLPVYREQDGLENKDGTRFFELGEFAQDDIRVNTKLTLNLGLRYDIFSPIGGKVGNFNLNTDVVELNFGPNAVKNAGVAYEKNDWGPRFGFAYSPLEDHKTVISGAFGIFYAPEGNQFNDIGENPPNLQYFQQNTPAQTLPSLGTMIDSGFPAILPTSDPASPSGQVKTTGPVRKAPRVLEWNTTIQRQLARDWMLNVAYVGTRATGVWNNEDSNLDQPQLPLDTNFSDPTGNMGRPYFNVLPNLQVINPIDYPNFDIEFHGLETKLIKRFTSGFTFLGSYTWSHTTGSWQGAHTGNTQIADDPDAQRGNVDPDFRHRLTASYTYELPFGRGKEYGSGIGGFENAVLGGWQVGGITTIRSGEHYTPFLSYDDTNTGTAAMPDMIHNPYDFSFDVADQANFGCLTPGHQSLTCWYNPTAFVIPPLAPGQGSAHDFGTARDGSLVGPDQVNFDFSAFKNFAITERQQLQFRAELFNIFNHPQFGLPARNPNTNGGAAITGTLGDNQREIQFALRYTF